MLFAFAFSCQRMVTEIAKRYCRKANSQQLATILCNRLTGGCDSLLGQPGVDLAGAVEEVFYLSTLFVVVVAAPGVDPLE